MNTGELKIFVAKRSPEERRWLAKYLWELEDKREANAADLSRRMREMDAGNKVTFAQVKKLQKAMSKQGR